jgi:Flp pilus assembly protein TadG
MKNQRSINQRQAAQAMIEFALVFPILLLLIYGIIEFGRMIFIYSAVTTASREASRYGSAAGEGTGGTPRYLDIDGMELAARRSLIAIEVPDDDIDITYDCGPATLPSSEFQDCTATQAARVLTSVSAQYAPIFNTVLFEINPMTISAASSRTIMREIAIEGTPAPVTGGTPDVFINTADFTSAAETGSIGVELRLTAASSSPVVVTLLVAGTATNGTDFTLSANPVTIPAGNIFRTVTIAITEDTLPEYNETVILVIESAVGANIGAPSSFTLTITDDDPPPYVVFTTQNAVIGEAGAGILVNVALNAEPDGSGAAVPAPGDVVVSFALGGSAIVGSDYALPFPTVTIPSGVSSASYTILILDDSADPVDEADETVSLAVGGVTGLARGDGTTSYTLTILDDDTAAVSWESSGFTISEEGGSITLRIVISPRSDQDVQVSFTRGGTATAGDYSLTASPVTIGSLTTGFDLTLTPVNDDTPEPNDTIILTLLDPANADLGPYPILTLDLEDGIVNQPISVRAFVPVEYNEGATVPVTFVAGGPVLGDVTVNFTLGGTASYTGTVAYIPGHIDYNLPATSVTIPNGTTSATINMALALDAVDEQDETVSITIQSVAGNAVIGTPNSGTFSILDTNTMPVVEFISIGRSEREGVGRIEIPLSMYPMSPDPVTVSFYYAITSTASSDPLSSLYGYDVLSTTVTFPAYTTAISLPVNLPENTIPVQDTRRLYIQIEDTFIPDESALRGTPYEFELIILENDVCATKYSAPVRTMVGNGNNRLRFMTAMFINTTTYSKPLHLIGAYWSLESGSNNNQRWTQFQYSAETRYDHADVNRDVIVDMSGQDYWIDENSGPLSTVFYFSRDFGTESYSLVLIWRDADDTYTCRTIIDE